MAPPTILVEAFSPYTKGSIKEIAESGNLSSIPGHYNFSQSESQQLPDPVSTEDIPTIDYNLLVNGTPDQRSQVISDLGHACSEWGFFMVVNHGVEERLREQMLEVCRDFFDLSEVEKGKYVGRNVLDPIRSGTSFNPSVETVFYWRDFIKVLVHPAFYSPEKPADFSYVINIRYDNKISDILFTLTIGMLPMNTALGGLVKELLKGVSESLGLVPCYLEKASELETGLQILIANLYPRCPQPELAMGLPPHSDHGLLTVLMQNNVGGLQVKHNGKWVLVNSLPNSFLVNTGDQLEILSNGKYISVLHRAVVNDRSARISIAIANGPSLGKAVAPAPQLVDSEHPPAYCEMTYREYVEFQQSNRLDAKS
ncbi:LOW QUALITY PROTEIN: 2OG-FeII_Oxy domain-containing protein/DIOX_N domain-containing protein [Cinnamomum micranthum f. kanehirae]|uniref:2OG-FeII_Oxy domain-containing protein/DIOX_N domain-containing protein n=1 Tax=Cinnamomum micranthum f. kanehirae TaxID=337451 RepID=A0A443NDE4_9MAGN|nr:LOW QUALITY PROTEIN: 2OG-FeII_Oxy domain-containing protein/DIOX_N domain-containing protein [Cinnamomum micranthum f. kanehirae]